jgi:hypothetical protein
VNIAARSLILRECPRCLVRQPLADFSPCSSYCRPCKRTYDRVRAQRLRSGTWQPYIKGNSLPPPPRPIPVAVVASSPADVESGLRSAMAAFLRECGFTALRKTYVRLENELARSKRVELAREGWIA